MAKDIKVTLTLDSKDFDKKITRAKGSMRGFGSASKVTTGSIIGLAARLAPLAAGVAAVSASFNQLGKSVAVASKIEDVQVTLSNIVGSAEGGAAALNKIRDVAKELPVSFEELASSAPALSTVSGTIGELEDNIRLAADIAGNFGIPFEVAAGQLQRAFSAGSGAADVFREKGVLAAAGFEAGVTLSIDETIAKLREFGGEIEGSAQKLAKTFSGAANQAGDAVFDFQAEIGNAIKPELTAFLQKITKLFRDNEKEVLAFAKAIGQNALKGIIAFGRGIATTIDIVRSIGKTAKDIGASIKANFGEQIEAVADGVVRAFAFIVEAISLVGVGLGKLISLTTGVNDVENFFESVNDAAANLRREGLSAIEDTSEAIGGFVVVTDARDAFNEFVDDVLVGGDKIRTDLQKTSDAAGKVGDNLAIKLGNGAIDGAAALAQMTAKASELATSLFNLLGAPNPGNVTNAELTERFSKAFKENALMMANMTDESGRLKIAMGIIHGLFRSTIPSVDEYNAAVKFLLENFEELGFTLPEITSLIAFMNKEFDNDEGIRNFIDTLETATKSLSTDLATAFMAGESAGDSFKKYFKSLVNQIIADVIRLSIIQPILSMFMNPFGYGFGSGGSIVKLATGGPVMKDKPYIVGERGPELFVPTGAGNIVPNHQMGGGAQQVTYNINAVDAASFKTLVARDPEFIYNVTRVGSRRVPG